MGEHTGETASLLLVTGPPGAGKSTAAQVLVQRFEPSVLVSADVELLRIDGGGHAWSGSALSAAVESIVGFTTTTVSANEQLWEFFEDRPLPGR